MMMMMDMPMPKVRSPRPTKFQAGVMILRMSSICLAWRYSEVSVAPLTSRVWIVCRAVDSQIPSPKADITMRIPTRR